MMTLFWRMNARRRYMPWPPNVPPRGGALSTASPPRSEHNAADDEHNAAVDARDLAENPEH